MSVTSAGWGNPMGLAGGVPLCDWQPIPTNANAIPLYVHLFRDVLNPQWEWEKNDYATITQSISFDDKKAPEYDQVKKLNDQVSAVIVRPGPNFDSHVLYKVTLYKDWKYKSFLLPLTLGVYPDIHRYAFGDTASSVKFEQGVPTDFPDAYSAARSYYW